MECKFETVDHKTICKIIDADQIRCNRYWDSMDANPGKDKIIEIGIIILYDGEKSRSIRVPDQPGIAIPPIITRRPVIIWWLKTPCVLPGGQENVEFTEGAVLYATTMGFDYNFIREEFVRLSYNFTRKQC